MIKAGAPSRDAGQYHRRGKWTLAGDTTRASHQLPDEQPVSERIGERIESDPDRNRLDEGLDRRNGLGRVRLGETGESSALDRVVVGERRQVPPARFTAGHRGAVSSPENRGRSGSGNHV